MWHAFEIATVLYVATLALMLIGEASWRRWIYRSAIWLALASVGAATWFV